MTRIGDWMQTFTGIQFWPLDPRVEEICIEDIAHSLANQCRFAGHVREFYSVAQHSVLVARLVPQEFKLWALLHDASEAYLVDLPRPVKRHSRMGEEYREIESRVMLAVCERFGLPPLMPACVHAADDVLLMTEKRDLMGHHAHLPKWRETAAPMPEYIGPWAPQAAELIFLTQAQDLISPLAQPENPVARATTLHDKEAL
jgi:hypothetical protein